MFTLLLFHERKSEREQRAANPHKLAKIATEVDVSNKTGGIFIFSKGFLLTLKNTIFTMADLLSVKF